MSERPDSAEKAHYICQTYVEQKGRSGAQPGLKIDKQLQYKTEAEAQERAEREFRLETCVGADAFMVIEDSASDEVSAPSFIVRLGLVPESEAF